MAKSKKKGLVKVKFLLSPTGKFSLGYSIGEQGQFSAEQAAELVESGYAVVVEVKDETTSAEETAPAEETALTEETATAEETAPAEETK